MTRIKWAPVIDRAAHIVNSYDIPVTLRQLFYRLVSEQLIPNRDTPYKTLSAKTAELRRHDEFPALYDRGRKIIQPTYFDNPTHGLHSLARHYRLDRTANQDVSLYLGVEKNALAGLLQAWFDDTGIPVLPLGGYSSASLDQIVKDKVEADGRPAVLIYAGDFDASGMDIGRNFVDQTNCWKTVHRIGLSESLISAYELPVLRGKTTDSRAPKFIDHHPEIHARHDFGCDSKGRRYPVQVELDAVDPAELHRLFQAAIDPYWDVSAYEAVLSQEHVERRWLEHLATTA